MIFMGPFQFKVFYDIYTCIQKQHTDTLFLYQTTAIKIIYKLFFFVESPTSNFII